jgi:hypothetical protein
VLPTNKFNDNDEIPDSFTSHGQASDGDNDDDTEADDNEDDAAAYEAPDCALVKEG